MKWVLGLLFGFGGLAVLAAGIAVGLERYQLFRTGTHAQGRVVEQIKTETPKDLLNPNPKGFRTQQTGQNITTYNAVVEFQTAAGEKVRFRNSLSSQDSLENAMGAAVNVIYDARNPATAQIGTLSELLLQPLFMILAGIFFSAMAVRAFFRD